MNYNDINSNKNNNGSIQMVDNIRRYNLFVQKLKDGYDPYSIDGYSKEEVDLFLSTINYDGSISELMNTSSKNKQK